MLDYLFSDYSEKIASYINTSQFKISEKIISKRFELGLSLEDMAEYLKLSPEDYIEYEYGSDKINVFKYRNILSEINNYKKINYKINDKCPTKVENRINDDSKDKIFFKKERNNKLYNTKLYFTFAA